MWMVSSSIIVKYNHVIYIYSHAPLYFLDYSDALSLDILTKLMYPRGPNKGGLILKQFEVCTCTVTSYCILPLCTHIIVYSSRKG